MSLTVTSPASDLALLSLDELRGAAARTMTDDELRSLGYAIADLIANYCRVRGDGVHTPTLLAETITESFLHGSPDSGLVLARRPIISVASIEQDTVAMDAADYDIEARAGILRRLTSNGHYRGWWNHRIDVIYLAGFEVVPPTLKLAAQRLITEFSRAPREAGLASIDIPGVVRRSYSISAPAGPQFPSEVCDMLEPYRNYAVA